MLLNNN